MNKPSAYSSFFSEIIDTINSARYQAFKSLNKFHIGQNFGIGRIIVENQDKNQWGQSIVDTLSKDINKQIDEYLNWISSYCTDGQITVSSNGHKGRPALQILTTNGTWHAHSDKANL